MIEEMLSNNGIVDASPDGDEISDMPHRHVTTCLTVQWRNTSGVLYPGPLQQVDILTFRCFEFCPILLQIRHPKRTSRAPPLVHGDAKETA